MRSLARAGSTADEFTERNKAKALKHAKRRRLEVLTLSAEDADGIGAIYMQELANEQKCIVVAAPGSRHRNNIFWPEER